MEDKLGRKPYATKIANEIIDHYKEQASKGDERENIIFAISGKWGEGKTALLGFIKIPLRANGFEIVDFNAWKYSQEDIALKRALLQVLKDKLNSPVVLKTVPDTV